MTEQYRSPIDRYIGNLLDCLPPDCDTRTLTNAWLWSRDESVVWIVRRLENLVLSYRG